MNSGPFSTVVVIYRVGIGTYEYPTYLNIAARLDDDIRIITLGLPLPVVSLQMSIHIAAHQISFAYLNITFR